MALLAVVAARPPASAWLSAQSPETFSATAFGTGAQSAVELSITFVVDRYSTESENTSLRSALSKGASAFHAALKAMPDVGTVTVRDKRTALKYTYKPPQNGGRTITFVTAEPLAYLDPGTGKDKPKDGYDVALARLDFSTPGFAVGQVSPAAKVTMNETGLILRQEYGASVVSLKNVEKR